MAHRDPKRVQWAKDAIVYASKASEDLRQCVDLGNVAYNFDHRAFPDFKGTRLSLVCQDTIVAGSKLLDQGLNPVCLNMASQWKPGGGYRTGCMAQEESLFYRTTYCCSLEPMAHSYPLGMKVLYSPRVEVFKDENYEWLKKNKRFEMAFLACAALRKPKLQNGQLTVQDYKGMVYRIRNILAAALMKGHDSIILGALGTGAYGCPCEDMAEAFRQVLYDEGWLVKFQYVIFAILPARRNDPLSVFQKFLCQD